MRGGITADDIEFEKGGRWEDGRWEEGKMGGWKTGRGKKGGWKMGRGEVGKMEDGYKELCLKIYKLKFELF